MKIGEYIRTKDGYIAKLEKQNDYLKTYYFDGYIWERGHIPANTISYNLLEKYIRKDIEPSEYIVDMLEVGDIIKLKDVKHYQEVLCIDKGKIYLSEFIYMSGLQKDIEWVVTHEQIESKEYKL